MVPTLMQIILTELIGCKLTASEETTQTRHVR